MKQWEKFELDCANYLSQKFGQYAQFILTGGADSTKSDIKAVTKSGTSFFLEAKHCPAQCGQFVLLPNFAADTFEFSSENATRPNQYTDAIIRHMNANFKYYANAGRTGKDIFIEDGNKIFADWITLTYKNKGVRFFITNNFAVIPIERFSDCFRVSAKYRIKKSGSSDVGTGRMNAITDFIKNSSYSINHFEYTGPKLFVTSLHDIDKQKFSYLDNDYMFSKRGGRYEVRKLSNTFNANVIFSIDIKSSAYASSDEQFVDALRY